MFTLPSPATTHAERFTCTGRAQANRATSAEWPGVDDGTQRAASYNERLQVGYRWYDTHGVTPAFPFGHGLSFTTFELSGLLASAASVSAVLRNTGTVSGAAVVQLYLGFPDVACEPPRQLKGFSKKSVAPGVSVTVTFPLDVRARSIWDTGIHAWVEAKGKFQVVVGLSSRDPSAVHGSFTTT